MKSPVAIPFEFGEIRLDKSRKPNSSVISHGGVAYKTPRPYSQADSLLWSALPDSLAGLVLQSLLGRMAVELRIDASVPLSIERTPEVDRLRADPTLDRVVQSVVRRLLQEVDEPGVHAALASHVDLNANILASNPALIHTHPKHLPQRIAYLGALAPLGGFGASALMGHYGYQTANRFDGSHWSGNGAMGSCW